MNESPDVHNSSYIIIVVMLFLFFFLPEELYSGNMKKLEQLWSFDSNRGLIANPLFLKNGRICLSAKHEANPRGATFIIEASNGRQVKNFPFCGFSSPVISGNKLISSWHRINCTDMDTGKIIWEFTPGGRTYSTPVIKDKCLFFTSVDKCIYRIGLSDGRLIWKFKTDGTLVARIALDENSVYTGNENGKFYCLDLTGSERWSFKSGKSIRAAPLITGDNVIFGSFDGNLYCLSKKDGKLVWKHQTGGIIFGDPAISDDGTVYAGSGDKHIYALDFGSGRLIWKTALESWISGSVTLHDNKVFVGDYSGKMYVLDADSGKIEAVFKTADWIRAKPVVADGKIYLASMSGTLHCLKYCKGE